MNEKYFNYLVEQFKQATGVKNVDVKSKTFLSEFYEWVNKRRMLVDGYLNLLDYMGLDFCGDRTAEIGKGIHDSVVDVAYFDTRIITPFSEGIVVLNQDCVITADFKVLGGLPTLISTDNKNNTILRSINPRTILTYMTQNPYTYGHIANWEKLHNGGDHDIVIGMYGSVYDKDKVMKTRQLGDLGSKLNGAFITEYDTVGDTYYYVVASKRNVKKIEKKKTRCIKNTNLF